MKTIYQTFQILPRLQFTHLKYICWSQDHKGITKSPLLQVNENKGYQTIFHDPYHHPILYVMEKNRQRTYLYPIILTRKKIKLCCPYFTTQTSQYCCKNTQYFESIVTATGGSYLLSHFIALDELKEISHYTFNLDNLILEPKRINISYISGQQDGILVLDLIKNRFQCVTFKEQPTVQ